MADTAQVIQATHRTLSELSDLTVEELLARWDALGSWNEADALAFAEQSTPIVTATSTTASATETALLTHFAGSLPPAADTAAVVAAQLAELRTPFTAVWHALSVGHPWEEAVASGRAAVEAYARDLAFQAARDTAAELSRVPTVGETWSPSRYQQRPTRYQRRNWDRPSWPRWGRVLSGQSCSWCQFFSTRTYFSAQTATFGHTRCDCLVAPVTADTEDFNESIRQASGYDKKKATDEMSAYNRRRRLSDSARTADRRQAAAKKELAKERDPARRDRIEARVQQWETRGEVARDRLRHL